MGTSKKFFTLILSLLIMSSWGPTYQQALASSLSAPANVVISRADSGLVLSWTPKSSNSMRASDKAVIESSLDNKKWVLSKSVAWWDAAQNVTTLASKALWVRVGFSRSGMATKYSQALKISEKVNLSDWEYSVCDTDNEECDWVSSMFFVTGKYLPKTKSLLFTWTPPDYSYFRENALAAPIKLNLKFSTPKSKYSGSFSSIDGKAEFRLSSADYTRTYEVEVVWTSQNLTKSSEKTYVERPAEASSKLKKINLLILAPSEVTANSNAKIVASTTTRTSNLICSINFGSDPQSDFSIDSTGIGVFQFRGFDLISNSTKNSVKITGVCSNKTYRAEIGPIVYLSPDGDRFYLSQ